MKQNAAERIARILGANQVRQSESNALCRCETVFTIEDHTVTAIEQQDSGAGTLVFRLMDVQIGIFQLQRQRYSFALHSREQSRADIKVQDVAEFILFG